MKQLAMMLALAVCLMLTGCGSAAGPPAVSAGEPAAPRVTSSDFIPPSAPPVIDESQIVRTEKTDQGFGYYSLLDYLADDRLCREQAFDSGETLLAAVYYDTDNGAAPAYSCTFQPDGSLVSYTVYDYTAEGAAKREIQYAADSPRLPIKIEDTDDAGRILYCWNSSRNGMWTAWECAYTPDSAKVTYTLQLDVSQDRVLQDRPGWEVRVAEWSDSLSLDYEMGAPEHQVIYGGHSADQRLTALSLIECDPEGNYLLLASFNEQGKATYLYDCVTGETLLDEAAFS